MVILTELRHSVASPNGTARVGGQSGAQICVASLLTQTHNMLEFNPSDIHETVHLPSSLDEWRARYPVNGDTDWNFWGETWNSLRPFFESKGYTLFQHDPRFGTLCSPLPDQDASPASDSFGLFGDREGYQSRFPGHVSRSVHV